MIDMFSILIGGLDYDDKGRTLNHAPKTSLLAAIFFAAHPVHTESVSRVSLHEGFIFIRYFRPENNV